uniref:Uncharacterized protein n=1 Tax=Physcomitrium patens TaxID=3218 RepID=A0A2K1IAL9_PHYPA|nr:hypothetical protein PHYPA_030888 [Physcomitrium patens]
MCLTATKTCSTIVNEKTCGGPVCHDHKTSKNDARELRQTLSLFYQSCLGVTPLKRKYQQTQCQVFCQLSIIAQAVRYFDIELFCMKANGAPKQRDSRNCREEGDVVTPTTSFCYCTFLNTVVAVASNAYIQILLIFARMGKNVQLV